ncbi:uncharacterized protein LOC126370538 [Pectinophora gossypiella]|uniref:uncharacterized protein LOC126370538 n=1 Tax=Pectinophora gossypiella TaxID=13191 RepID=UPI00214E518D|nr:uncharacterized protein LOC126370538 [Pectinophora gossypiella]
MKPEESNGKGEEVDNPAPVTGDVIGDTAYSERFVLKILLKLANKDTLKDEIQEKSFEDDLCTLWDMTAERDVVLFLLKHDVLSLFNFALPDIESPRFIEIIIGIVGNMCCQKEAVATLLKMDSFLTSLLEYMKSDDSLILIQVLRLVSSSLFIASEDDLLIWLTLFKSVDYSNALYFMLKNSSHKELLVTALENFNTVTSYCNIEKFRLQFFTHFVTPEAMESLSTAFTEVTTSHKDACEKEELERIFDITLQLTLNLVGFDKSPEIYEGSKQDAVKIITNVLCYYENKLVDQKEIDTDVVDIIDSTNTVVHILKLSEICDPDKYCSPSYNMWKTLKSITKSNKNGCSFEEDDIDDLEDFVIKMKCPLSTLICNYLAKCSENNLLKVLDEIGSDYEEIFSLVTDEEIRDNVSKRAANYTTRLKDNVDS